MMMLAEKNQVMQIEQRASYRELTYVELQLSLTSSQGFSSVRVKASH